MGKQIYTIPVSGRYHIKRKTTTYITTGKFETVNNPNKEWFEFWKPKMITREIFDRVDTDTSNEVKFLSKGDVIEVDLAPLERINIEKD